ncbi:MAG: bifunctional glutamine synthetase adenylyltransferase/deadenyltransferase, partial [Beggiatoa sp. IS2]
GLVFRVDMRLRPFGDSGPLVMSFAAMEEYYQSHARDWERYALIKARIAAGDPPAGEILLKMLQPFIYRRYLDYNAFESLRTMKALIDHETRLKGWESNIKLGSGGIREIEFICQCFQLIRGGRQPALQQRQLLATLKQLEKYHLLPAEVVEQLREAYQFLRLTENHLQAIEDRQTQSLPQDILHQTRLAYSMGFYDWRSFMTALRPHQEFVHTQFKQVIAPAVTEETSEVQMTLSNHCQTLWIQILQEDSQAEVSLSTVGFTDTQGILEHLRQLVRTYAVQKLSKRGRERLDMLMPLLLATVLKYPVPDITLHRTLSLVEAVALRSVYLALLIERPQVLEQLVRLCASSAWIAEQITRYPLLLDELLDPRHLYDPLKPDELDNALQAQLAHLPSDDLEMQMDSMRQFKRAYVLQVAATEISGNLTVEVTSDYLAAIADTLVRCALTIAWDYLTQKHGRPLCNEGNTLRSAGFCVIAYGKAGGIELSYDSDLDIVFLHDSCGTDQYTNGTKPLDNNVFFSRLAQRIIHILNTNTPAGILYEVDPRLRPGGDSGLIVSSLDAFKTYQLESAWTWEHQALVRARALAGNTECIAKFAQIRREVLSIHRNPEELRQEVREMRTKMREHLDKSNLNIFDLKQGLGGIADIEFIVQYEVLRWATQYPHLLEKTAVLPIMRLFAQQQLLEMPTCEQLSTAYRTYRAEAHRLALQNQPALVSKDKFVKLREHVIDWWQKMMEVN